MNLLIRAIKYGCMQVHHFFRLKYNQFLWLLKNKENKTRMGNYFPIERVSVGRFTYGKLVVHHFDAEGEGLSIGEFCSIGPDVEFFLGGEHHPYYLSNYPYGLYIAECSKFREKDLTTKGKIIIGDDVWIGAHCLIMSGVNIGKGAIVGAGSVVTKDIPPYAVFAEGEIKKYRFDEETIAMLMKINYSKLNKEFLQENGNLFYEKNVKQILEEGIRLF